MPDQNPSVLIVIPARLSSQRLPGKMLLHETGKPLLQHTWEAVRQVKKAEQVVVATDHEDIRSTVEGFGGNAVMTSPTAPNGTARIVEALSQFPNAEIIVNVREMSQTFHPRRLSPQSISLPNVQKQVSQLLSHRFVYRTHSLILLRSKLC